MIYNADHRKQRGRTAPNRALRIKAKIDWSSMPVDTPIYVSQDNQHWHPRHFHSYEDGCIYAWADGKTSFTAEPEDYVRWYYTKRADNK